MRAGRRFAELQDVAGKAAEQAGRIAGVLAIVDEPDAKDISADAMGRACILMRWYLGEAARLADEHFVPARGRGRSSRSRLDAGAWGSASRRRHPAEKRTATGLPQRSVRSRH